MTDVAKELTSLYLLLMSAILLTLVFIIVFNLGLIDPFTGTSLAQAYLALKYGYIRPEYIVPEYSHTHDYISSMLIVPGLLIAIISEITLLKPELVLYLPIPLLVITLLLHLVCRNLVKQQRSCDTKLATRLMIAILICIFYQVFLFAYMNFPVFEYHGIKYLYFLLTFFLTCKLITGNLSRSSLTMLIIAYVALVHTHYRFFLIIPVALLSYYLLLPQLKERSTLLFCALILLIFDLTHPFIPHVLKNISIKDIIELLVKLLRLETVSERIKSAPLGLVATSTLYKQIYLLYRFTRGIHTISTLLLLALVVISSYARRYRTSIKRNLYSFLPHYLLLVGFANLIITEMGYIVACKGIAVPTIGPEVAWITSIGSFYYILYIHKHNREKARTVKTIQLMSMIASIVLISGLVMYPLFFLNGSIRIQREYSISETPPPFYKPISSASSFITEYSTKEIRMKASIHVMFSTYMSMLTKDPEKVFKGHVVVTYGNVAPTCNEFLILKSAERKLGLYVNLGQYFNASKLVNIINKCSLVFNNMEYLIYGKTCIK